MVLQYNQSLRSGRYHLGREYMPMEISNPLHYALIHLGSSATSAAGVAVSRKMQVMRDYGSTVAGLSPRENCGIP